MALRIVQLMLIARFFGTSNATDAYMVAMWTPMLVWSLGDTVLVSALVPYLVSLGVKKGKEAAKESAGGVLSRTFLLSLFFALLVLAFAPYLVRLFAPGFAHEHRVLTTRLVRVLTPAIFLSGLTSFLSSLSYAARKFLAPAVAALIPSLAIILFLLLFVDRWSIYSVVAGFSSGLAVQLTILIVALLKHGLLPRFHWKGLDKNRGVLRRLAPRFGHNLLSQAISVVDRLFASTLAVGSISILAYSFQVARLTPMVIESALGKTLMPLLSKIVAEGKLNNIREFIPRYVGLITFIMAPIALILIYFRIPVIHILYQRGNFTSDATMLTAHTFIFYMLAVTSQSVRMVFGGVFAATGDTLTPFAIGILSFLLNIPLNYFFSRQWDLAGIAIATLCISALGMILTFERLNAKIGPFRLSLAFKALVKIALAVVVMGFSIWAIDTGTSMILNPQSVVGRLALICLCAFMGCIIYLLVCYVLRLKELLSFRSILGARPTDRPREISVTERGIDEEL